MGGAGSDFTTYTGKDTKGVSHTYTYITGEIMYDADGKPCGHTVGDLQIDDSKIVIKNYARGMGLTLSEVAPAPPTVVQLTDLTANDKILDSRSLFVNWHLGTEYDTGGTYRLVYEHNTIQGTYLYGDDGASNPDYHQVFSVKGEAIYGSAMQVGYTTYASDHIIGSASDDYVEGDGGLGDIIEAGKGHDRVFEMRGDDVISGGADSDILFGGGAANDARYEGEREVA